VKHILAMNDEHGRTVGLDLASASRGGARRFNVVTGSLNAGATMKRIVATVSLISC
jgi:hypothetical protein